MTSQIDSKVVSSTVALQPRLKRAAFADVSNTKAIAPIQQSNNGFKKVVVQQDKIVKPAASRPALRNAVKEVEVVSTASVATGNKHHEPLGRKVSTKKSTAVYQDKPQASTAGAIRKERSVSIVQQTQTQSTVPLQQVRAVARQNNGGRFKEQIEKDEEEEEEAVVHKVVNEDMKVGILESNVDSDGSEPEDDEYEEAEEENEHSDDECQYDSMPKAKRRSHGGENTTGAITTTLFPKVTSNDKKELAQVKKDFFDADEDDTWDVTMVAEYGDEIFEYMRELEVCFHYTCSTLLLLTTFTGKNVTKRTLYGPSNRNPMVNEIYLDGLDSPSARTIWTSARDTLPLRKLHRSIPFLQSCLIRQTTTGWCYGFVRCC